MPSSDTQRASDRWLGIALSVLLHGALLAALVYGWMLYRQPPPPKPTLAIEAQVVDSRAVQGAVQAPKPAPPAPPPPPPPVEASGPPQPTPQELAQREEQRKQAAEAAAQAQREAEEKAAQQKAAEEAAQKKAEVERKAKEAAEAKKRAAEQKLAQEQQRQQEAQAKSDLQQSLAAEEQANARRAAAGPALANWQAQIAAKITRNWIRPPTARTGIECMLNVTQVPGGEVTQVTIGQCNGDAAVRESIEAAVYRASPLPAPPDPSLFDRNLRIDFKPD
jgi:colicin import membrane protein